MGGLVNPLLQEINSLSPAAKTALQQAHAQSTPAQPPSVFGTNPPSQIPQHIPAPGSTQQAAPMVNPDPQGSLRPGGSTPPAPMLPPGGSPPASFGGRGSIPGEEAETARLIGAPTGVSQIHSNIENSSFGQNHPTLGKVAGWAAQIPAEIGSRLGHIVAPGLTSQIPGTEDSKNRLIAESARNTGLLQGERATDTTNALNQAKIGTEESKPELAEAKSELAQEKQGETEEHHHAQVNEQLRAHGYKTDEKGNIVPLKYEEMSPQQQAVTDLRGAQEEYQHASADLKKAQKDNIPSQVSMAQQRLITARENAATAAGRLGLSQKEFLANYYGVDEKGEPLPGVPATESGAPEGLKTAGITKPPAVAQGKASQGRAIVEAAGNLQKEIDKNRDLMGNLGSYWKQYANGTPIADPRAAKLMAEFASFAALQPALHGFRSHDALREFGKMIGGIPNNPDAAKAAIQGIVEGAANPMIHQGSMRTVESGKASAGGGESQYKEGDTATGPGGHKVKFTKGQWVPQ